VNADFEQGKPGQSPAGWELRALSRSQNYKVQVSEHLPHAGRHCVKIGHPEGAPWGHLGLVAQSVDAATVRGKRVRFRAAVRTEVVAGGRNYAALWARAVRPAGKPCPYVDGAGYPVRSPQWSQQRVLLDVSEDAERLEVGFLLNATGRAWFDDASLEVVGKAGVGNEAPRALSAGGLENLVALTRLLGHVRYFHPSDAAATADWDRFAVEAIGVVEPAKTPAELASRLTDLTAGSPW
jgi:hypothetical protein